MANDLTNTMELARPHTTSADERLEQTSLAPILTVGRGVWLAALVLAAIAGWGAFAYLTQLRHGLQVTGLNCPIFWGVYITNFVFFVGISHAGTLISAILRITGAEWRRPITRMAEAITVLALMCGPINILFDLGRPDRMLNVFKHPHFASPILWDVWCITTYFFGSLTYLYLPLVPDIALLRERSPRFKWFYRLLTLWWTGSERQWHILERAISVMAVIIIPLAVSVHTVVSYVFAMTVQPMWHSAMFGPYFVVGAIFSGIAALILAMALLRRLCHLEEYLRPFHFVNLGWLLLTMCLLWFYFTFGEFLTTFYGQSPDEMRVFNAKMYGEFSLPFWAMVIAMWGAFFVLTLPLLPTRARQPQSVAVWVLCPATAAVAGALALYAGGLHPATPVAGVILSEQWLSLLYRGGMVFALGYFVWSFMPLLRDRPIARTVTASILVTLGMWLERYTIVVPTLSHPRLPWGVESYAPSWVEWSITAGLFAFFSLLFLLFAKVFPLLPIWEIKQTFVPGNIQMAQVFDGLQPAQMEGFLQSLRHQFFAPNEIILRQGERSSDMYLIISGEIEVAKETLGGAVPIAHLGPGSCFGEVGLFLDEARTASVRALAPTECRIVQRADLERLSASAPAAAQRLTQNLLRVSLDRFNEINKHMTGTLYWITR